MQTKWKTTDYKVSISSPSSEGGGGEYNPPHSYGEILFPLVLLQAKVVGSKNTKTKAEALVSISSPSSEGGGLYFILEEGKTTSFPLVLLQAKVVGFTDQLSIGVTTGFH